jgi:glycosyltransferase involved in cell wall biosynthesis/spore maturation protein CgeB
LTEKLSLERETVKAKDAEIAAAVETGRKAVLAKESELETARREVEKIGALSAGVQDELNEAKSRIQGLENSLERAKENAAHAQHINDEAEQRILKFAEAAKSLERQLEVVHQAMETAKADLVAATKREEEARTTSAKTDAQLKQVSAKVVTLEVELAKAKAVLSSEQKKSADQAAALKKANDACVEERKKTSTLTAQMKERDAKNLELRKEKQTLHSANRKLEKRLKRAEFDYNKLSKAKLGRLTLAYWRWKDGVKSTEKNVAKAVDCNGRSLQKTHMPVSSAKSEESSRLPAGERMLEKLRDAASKGMLNYRERCNFLKGVKVACIMDEFTWKSYSPEANMIQLVPENYETQLNTFRPELIFVESAWRGVDNKWTNCIHRIPDELKGVLNWAKRNSVLTVFWNKEDPIHFDTFKNVASLFDFIFTYDFNCVEKYKRITGRNNAFFLPMAVQPTMFNPIEKYDRKDAFCFAGSYYKRYAERTKDLDGYIKAFPAYKNVEIYDRQFGKDDPNYMMPPEYAPYIKGNLPYDEIDKAYKGYTVSINLNSIKQANSIARRVFELLACNTVTVSNYSYGVVSGFGKLVITSDNADVILATLKNYENVPRGLDKFRLLGLRKVFSENTYEDRFAYICSKVLGVNLASYKPIVAVVAAVRNEEEYQKVKSSFERQKYGNKKLIVLTKGNVSAETVIKGVDDLPQHLDGIDYVGMMSPHDYYSASYLEDMAYAFRYAFVNAVGKGSYFRNKKNKVVLQANKKPYSKMCGVNLYRGMMTMPAFMTAIFDKPKVLTSSTPEVKIETLSIDYFNYCESGCLNGLSESQISEISDLTGVDTGFDFSKMQKDAETLEPVLNKIEGGLSLSSTKLYEYCKKVKCANIEQIFENGRMSLLSSLDKGAHAYFPINKEFQIEDIPLKDGALCLNQEVGYSSSVLSSIAYFFYDARKRKISSALGATNANLTIEVPKDAKFVKFQFRLQGSGTLEVGALNFSHKPTPLPYSFDDSKILCLTNHYPSYDNIYCNGFVHARIKLYEQKGVKVSVFQFSKATQVQFSEFEGINVVSGNSDYLRFVLANNKYSTILVHFLDSEMWEVLKELPETTRIIVWCHGAEVLKYTRRLFNFEGMEIPANVIAQSEARGKFWSSLLKNLPKNIHFVFVSQWMKDIVDEDYSVKIPMEYYSIINNPINTEIFQYVKKDAEQRYHILSIRPYATRKYANDLSVKCILELSKRPDFKKFEITMIGDGKLFDDVLAPLRGYENVHILRTFLRQEEIYEYHKKNGIFLVPTRQDSQGVSKDEAMSSGLVPITNNVAAIPEFVDASCGVLSPAEDYKDMAQQIGRIVDDPKLFLSMSRAAAERVRRQTASDVIVEKELSLIKGAE